MDRFELLTALVASLKQERNWCLKDKHFDRLRENEINWRLKEATIRLAVITPRQAAA